MIRNWSVVLGSLVGAFAIHGVLVACSSGGTVSNGPTSEGTAHADPASVAASCTQWEVKTVTPRTFSWDVVNYTDPQGVSRTIQLPAIGDTTLESGWEPFGTAMYSPMVRRCVK